MITALSPKHVATRRAQRYVMGTFLTIELSGTDTEVATQCLHQLFGKVQELEEKLSIYRPESEISQINQSAGERPISVSEETFRVLEEALSFAAFSGGAFDPTARPMTPADYRQVVLNPSEQTVFLSRGVRLDLGGIGKGFALDEALKQVTPRTSIESIRMDFGGQLVFWNRAGFFPAETVLIESSLSKEATASRFVMDENGSVSTSSQAERPGHLLDPLTGQAAHVVKSVTIVAPTATEAEAFSTALFVLGAEKGSGLLESAPHIRAFFWEGDPL